MSTTEYQQRISDLVARLKAEAPLITLKLAQSGLSVVKNRSIQDGITVDGAFAEYSTKPVYKSSFKKKALNNAGSAYASSGGKGTWGEFRGAQGRKRDTVNLFYTGRMWTSLHIVSQEQNGNRYSVLVGPSDKDSEQILAGNIKRYGNFFKLTEQEVKNLEEDIIAEINDIINSVL